MSDAHHQSSLRCSWSGDAVRQSAGLRGAYKCPPNPHPIYKRNHIIANVLKLSSATFSITGNTNISMRENTACRRLTGGR